MKRNSIFLKAFLALSVATQVGTIAKAQSLAAGVTGNVNILTPSTQNFVLGTSSSAPSTIQYNGSQGQNNNFAVGTTTSFGVNASASSTPDYSVASQATFGSATGTSFTNQIGSSGAASAANSYATSASQSAQQAQSYQASQAWDVYAGVGNTTKTVNGTTVTKEGWEAEWKVSAAGKQAYTDSYKSAFSAISQGSTTTTDLAGTISGSFQSTQGGSGSNSSNNTEKLYVNESGSYREATSDDYKARLTGSTVNFYTGSTSSAAAASSTQIQSAAAVAMAASAVSNTSNSVTVKGIGADATFVSGTATKFDSTIGTNLGKTVATSGSLILTQGDGQISSSATANGSAAGNFGTNSTASSNSATYSSVFYQAF
jgi:hypothetical protein